MSLSKLKARDLPSDDSHCGWLATLPPAPPPRRLEGRQRTDFAVIGAGFTGLAAARRLAEIAPEARIAIVDAQRAGAGASGRSSGFVVDLAGFIADMPEEHGERFIRLSRAGIHELRRLVAEHGIGCDWDERGFLHAAAGDSGMRSLENLHAWLEKRGERFEWLDRPAMEGVAGIPFYRAGIRLPGSVLIHAGALVRGLAAALPPSVELFEESAVRSIERGRGFHLKADRGSIVADKLIVALNGYSPGLGVAADRVFPLVTFGSLTRQLTPEEQADLGGEREWGLLAQDPMGSSVRRTRGQRLLIRNFVHYDSHFHTTIRTREKAMELHRQALSRRFPAFGGIEIEYSWAGVMGVSPNHFPFFGRLGPDGAAAAGFTGAGIAAGTTAGRLLADLVIGVDSDLLADQMALPGPRWLPPRPFLDLGIRVRVARMNASAGATL